MPQDHREKDLVRPSLIDVALNKPAWQSSYSKWSVAGEAANAVSDKLCDDFAFHTDLEASPFWIVDLCSIYCLEEIEVHNRIGSLQERARLLRVEVSDSQPGIWRCVHAGYSAFGSQGLGTPLRVRLASEVAARFIRVSLDGENYLHLSRVRVLVRPELLVIKEFCNKYGLRVLGADKSLINSYTIVAAGAAKHDQIVGIRISYSARFGNLLHQYVNAIQFAQRTGLKFIQVGSGDLLNIEQSFDYDGIKFIPSDHSLPEDGLFISGEFFNTDDLVPVLGPFLRFNKEEEEGFTSVVQRFIRPMLMKSLPDCRQDQLEDEVTIHIRSGDIFDGDQPVTYGYRQPPLSFYTRVIDNLRCCGVARARLVFEDRGNPCVDALCAWLDESALPYRVQCGSLRDDLAALIDAPHLVFGHGTFGYAAVRLSQQIKTLHYFAPELGGNYGAAPAVSRVFKGFDKCGEYIPAFEYGRPFEVELGWRNTPQMRERMLSYPSECIAIEELSRGSSTSA